MSYFEVLNWSWTELRADKSTPYFWTQNHGKITLPIYAYTVEVLKLCKTNYQELIVCNICLETFSMITRTTNNIEKSVQAEVIVVNSYHAGWIGIWTLLKRWTSDITGYLSKQIFLFTRLSLAGQILYLHW